MTKTGVIALIGGALAVSFLPIWRGAGHPRNHGVSLWQLMHDSTHILPDNSFGHPHSPYGDATNDARTAWIWSYNGEEDERAM